MMKWQERKNSTQAAENMLQTCCFQIYCKAFRPRFLSEINARRFNQQNNPKLYYLIPDFFFLNSKLPPGINQTTKLTC